MEGIVRWGKKNPGVTWGKKSHPSVWGTKQKFLSIFACDVIDRYLSSSLDKIYSLADL